MGHLHRHKLLALANAERDGSAKGLSRLERATFVQGAQVAAAVAVAKRKPAKGGKRKGRRRAS